MLSIKNVTNVPNEIDGLAMYPNPLSCPSQQFMWYHEKI